MRCIRVPFAHVNAELVESRGAGVLYPAGPKKKETTNRQHAAISALGESNSNQLGNRLAMIEQVSGASGGVDELGFLRVDAAVAVNGRENFVDMHGALGGFASHAVGGTDDLAHF